MVLEIQKMELEKKLLSDIVVWMKYAKYLPELNRREVWSEIVDRNKAMHIKKFPKLKKEINEAYQYVYDRKVLPSMRSMQFAGKAIDRNPVRIFNCSYLPMDCIDAFSEVMFLLLSGTGVGYSVQTHHIKKLPEIRKPKKNRRYLIGDTLENWADSVNALMSAYLDNKSLPNFDFSDIRPKGAPLVTSGGKAPGPEPLKECLLNIKKILDRKNDGDKLTSLEIHDINCHVADCILSGGIRRSATISLFDLDDDEMLSCKSTYVLPPINNEFVENGGFYRFYVEYLGNRYSVALPSNGDSNTLSWGKYLESGHKLPWYFVAPHRGRANNTAVILRHKIKKEKFFELWKTITDNNTGEPGLFFSNDKDLGLNPCSEVSLEPKNTCNLTEINVSDVDTQEELNNRSKAASFIGTLQASYTNFHYLRDIWKETVEKYALIGVGMTGIASGKVLSLNLEESANIVKEENERVAKLIGINKAARCTVIKPSGTTSLVVGSSSGIHAWHDKYYIRRMRVGKNESIYAYLKANHPEILEDEHFRPDTQAIITIPQKAPEGAITRSETALELLTRVSRVWNDWVKPGHRKGDNINNVSTTVTVKPNEWEIVGNWMWEHKNDFTALSVLPENEKTYIQLPFESISKKKYEELVKILHDVDLTKVIEHENNTNLQGEAACAGESSEKGFSGCEVI